MRQDVVFGHDFAVEPGELKGEEEEGEEEEGRKSGVGSQSAATHNDWRAQGGRRRGEEEWGWEQSAGGAGVDGGEGAGGAVVLSAAGVPGEAQYQIYGQPPFGEPPATTTPPSSATPPPSPPMSQPPPLPCPSTLFLYPVIPLAPTPSMCVILRLAQHRLLLFIVPLRNSRSKNAHKKKKKKKA